MTYNIQNFFPPKNTSLTSIVTRSTHWRSNNFSFHANYGVWNEPKVYMFIFSAEANNNNTEVRNFRLNDRKVDDVVSVRSSGHIFGVAIADSTENYINAEIRYRRGNAFGTHLHMYEVKNLNSRTPIMKINNNIVLSPNASTSISWPITQSAFNFSIFQSIKNGNQADISDLTISNMQRDGFVVPQNWSVSNYTTSFHSVLGMPPSNINLSNNSNDDLDIYYCLFSFV